MKEAPGDPSGVRFMAKQVRQVYVYRGLQPVLSAEPTICWILRSFGFGHKVALIH